MKLSIFWIVFFVLYSPQAFSEERLLLKDAVRFTLKNNLDLKFKPLNDEDLLVNQSLLLSKNNSNLSIQSEGDWLELPEQAIISNNKSLKLSLAYSKKLYDFGLTDALNNEYYLEKDNITFAAKLKRNEVILKVLTDYFNVIISDLNASVWNEGLSIAYIRQDNAAEQLELKEITELDHLKLKNSYQEVLIKRVEAENQQRLSRSQLAVTMGSEHLPSNLEVIKKINWNKGIPEYEELLSIALQNNMELRKIQKEISIAKQKSKTSDKSYGPSLSLEAELSAYDVPTYSSYPASVRLFFDYPLYSGNAKSLSRQKINVEIKKLNNQLAIVKNKLKHQLLAIWQNLHLLKLKKEKSDVNEEFQDYSLDKNRALYELELESNLGDAMTKYSQAILEAAKVDYQWVLAWEELSLLLEQPKFSVLSLNYDK